MKKLILALLIIVLSACSTAARSELSSNRQTWQSAHITHYRFSLNVGCFCVFRSRMPLEVEVNNGEVVSMTYADGVLVAEADPNRETFSKYATIDRLFNELETTDAEEVTVTYDATRGFPSEIYFDFIKAAADDELSISAADFEVLP